MDQNNNQAARDKAARERKKRLRWGLLSALIAAFTIWAVTSHVKDFSLRTLLDCLAGAKPGWMLCAVAAMLGFILFEGLAIRSACLAMQYPTSVGAGCSYAAADIYFSAITPSASGGQPAAALLMRHGGIPGSVAAAVLMLTLTMYAFSVLLVGVLCFVLAPSVYWAFGPFARVLIAIGFGIQTLLAAGFVLLFRSEGLVRRIVLGLVRILAALRLLRNPERAAARLERTITEYHRRAGLLTGHRHLLLRSLGYNLLQRFSMIAVSVFVFLALGGRVADAPNIFAVQSYTVIGSNCMPIPGAMGISDYLLLDGFQAYLSPELVVSMELITRSVSFYCCVLLCGLIVLFASHRKRKVDQP